jgi:hypothetical protein
MPSCYLLAIKRWNGFAWHRVEELPPCHMSAHTRGMVRCQVGACPGDLIITCHIVICDPTSYDELGRNPGLLDNGSPSTTWCRLGTVEWICLGMNSWHRLLSHAFSPFPERVWLHPHILSCGHTRFCGSEWAKSKSVRTPLNLVTWLLINFDV